jgi:RNA polymerase sigma-70 factor (ECF subfamily)
MSADWKSGQARTTHVVKMLRIVDEAPPTRDGPAEEGTDGHGGDLLLRAANRDEAAVRALYREHVERVFRTVARILGPADSDVDDVVQHVFLAALAGAKSFDGRSKVSTWLVGIATRRALDAARARYRRDRWRKLGRAVGVRSDDSEPLSLDLAERALADLQPEHRAVFVLHEVEGYTLREIEEMTNVRTSTLHARLVAARRRLDAIVAEIEGGSHERA